MKKLQQNSQTERRLEDASLWAVRLAGEYATETDWLNFTAWLEADDLNRAAYEQVEDLQELIDDQREAITSQNMGQTSTVVSLISRLQMGKTAKRVVVTAISAAAVFLFVVFGFNGFEGMPETQAYATGAGERRLVALADGSNLRLNFNTSVEVTLAKGERRPTLLTGEALFNISPDSDRPFFVRVGDRQIRVVGTVFNVLHHDGAVTVTVAEGVVEVGAAGFDNNNDNDNGMPKTNPRQLAEPTARLTAGNQLYHLAGELSSTFTTVDVERVTAWQNGFLAYEDTRLAFVIEDLNRYFKKQIIVHPDAADLRFSGILDVSDQMTILKLIADVLPIEVSTEGPTIVIRKRP